MVYILDNLCTVTPELLERAKRDVSPQRLEYAARYRFFKDQVQSVMVFLLLRYALKQEKGMDTMSILDYSGGKPVLTGEGQPCFNLSHCRQAVACGLSDSPLGVDVQDWMPRHLSVAKQVCSPEELAALELSAEPEIEFARLWTRKESYGKYTGRGILYPLQEINLWEKAPKGTVMETFTFPDFALSYCAEKKLEIRKLTIEELLQGREIE